MEINQATAKEIWSWVRENPLVVVGAAIGIGWLLAWQRRGSPSWRLAHMNADQPIGHTRGFSVGTDEVAEKMSLASIP
jgi:hypothetical protein